MLELASRLWNASKAKFSLVLIPVAILVILAVAFKNWQFYLLNSAKKLLEKMLEKDKKLNNDAEKANANAELHKARADDLGKKISDTDKENDPDWNKKV